MISSETAEIIERFTKKVKRAAQAHSKDIRLDIEDATGLMAEIANIMAQLVVYESAALTARSSANVQMDGGSFKS
jgi:hypothetical protein